MSTWLSVDLDFPRQVGCRFVPGASSWACIDCMHVWMCVDLDFFFFFFSTRLEPTGSYDLNQLWLIPIMAGTRGNQCTAS